MNTLDLKFVNRPWGQYSLLYQSHDYWTKIIIVNPGESLSLQYHENRAEYWTPLDDGLRGVINGSMIQLQTGKRYDVMRNVLHRVTNPTDYRISFIEIATGRPDESDIIRVRDKYGRA